MVEPFKNLAWDDFRLVRAVAMARAYPAPPPPSASIVPPCPAARPDRGSARAQLFERHRTGYALTATGEDMVALAERFDDEINSFTRKIDGSEIVPEGELRVTTNDSLLVDVLTPIFADFQRAYPKVQLDIILANQSLNLARRDADVAIRATDNPPDTLIGRRVARVAWGLYCRAQDYPRLKKLSEDALFKERWVSLGDTLGQFKLVKYARAHVAPENTVYKISTVLGPVRGDRERDRHRPRALFRAPTIARD